MGRRRQNWRAQERSMKQVSSVELKELGDSEASLIGWRRAKHIWEAPTLTRFRLRESRTLPQRTCRLPPIAGSPTVCMCLKCSRSRHTKLTLREPIEQKHPLSVRLQS